MRPASPCTPLPSRCSAEQRWPRGSASWSLPVPRRSWWSGSASGSWPASSAGCRRAVGDSPGRHCEGCGCFGAWPATAGGASACSRRRSGSPVRSPLRLSRRCRQRRAVPPCSPRLRSTLRRQRWRRAGRSRAGSASSSRRWPPDSWCSASRPHPRWRRWFCSGRSPSGCRCSPPRLRSAGCAGRPGVGSWRPPGGPHGCCRGGGRGRLRVRTAPVHLGRSGVARRRARRLGAAGWCSPWPPRGTSSRTGLYGWRSWRPSGSGARRWPAMRRPRSRTRFPQAAMSPSPSPTPCFAPGDTAAPRPRWRWSSPACGATSPSSPCRSSLSLRSSSTATSRHRRCWPRWPVSPGWPARQAPLPPPCAPMPWPCASSGRAPAPCWRRGGTCSPRRRSSATFRCTSSCSPRSERPACRQRTCGGARSLPCSRSPASRPPSPSARAASASSSSPSRAASSPLVHR